MLACIDDWFALMLVCIEVGLHSCWFALMIVLHSCWFALMGEERRGGGGGGLQIFRKISKYTLDYISGYSKFRKPYKTCRVSMIL